MGLKTGEVREASISVYYPMLADVEKLTTFPVFFIDDSILLSDPVLPMVFRSLDGMVMK